jgi:dsDNA-specific endonuclease/ATPase MutS2
MADFITPPRRKISTDNKYDSKDSGLTISPVKKPSSTNRFSNITKKTQDVEIGTKILQDISEKIENNGNIDKKLLLQFTRWAESKVSNISHLQTATKKKGKIHDNELRDINDLLKHISYFNVFCNKKENYEDKYSVIKQRCQEIHDKIIYYLQKFEQLNIQVSLSGKPISPVSYSPKSKKGGKTQKNKKRKTLKNKK